MARAIKPREVDPDKLKRERAGRYMTPDGRFVLEGDRAGSWYLADNERQDDLGMALLAGPFATLDEARARIAQLREGTSSDATKAGSVGTKASPRQADEAVQTRAATPKLVGEAPTAPRRRKTQAPEAQPPTDPKWLAGFPPERQIEARHLLAVLERFGLDDQSIVRRDIEADLPEVARTLLARRIRHDALEIWRQPGAVEDELESVHKDVRRHFRPLVTSALDAAARFLAGKGSPDDAADFAWLVALRTVGAVFDAIEGEGDGARIAGEPGWRLLELDGRREPTGRAIAIDQSDVLESTGD